MKITSTAYRLPRTDIDTDLIIPAKYLKVTDKAGLAAGCFANLKAADPNFPLLRPALAGSRILIAGANFGCGSSREHAVWALKQNKIEVVIASDFADIFAGNAAKNDLLLITLPEQVVQQLLAQTDETTLNIDLDAQIVSDSLGDAHEFSIDTFTKRKLLEGISELDYLRENLSVIKRFATTRKAFLPTNA